ncbi:MAG: hypothetical protein ACYCWW_10685 [Deltaproteobacteria bacterium]
MKENEAAAPAVEALPSTYDAPGRNVVRTSTGRWMEEGDQELVRGFLAREPLVETAFVFRLNGLLERVCRRDTPRLQSRFISLRADAYELLAQWRVSGLVRLDEPLPFLARRLWKQAMEAEERRRQAARKERSLDEGFDEREPDAARRLAWRREQVERAATEAAAEIGLEQQTVRRELAAWLASARERLSPKERESYDAELRVAEGDAPSLHEALGISEAAGRQRRRRLRLALGELARKDGAEELLELLQEARSTRRDKGVARS